MAITLSTSVSTTCHPKMLSSSSKLLALAVGTRHDCCVLQRCMDHASGQQKGQLVQHASMYDFSLVQDPFGNHVAQYILDLGEPEFSTSHAWTVLEEC